jgi:hypothetical protein
MNQYDDKSKKEKVPENSDTNPTNLPQIYLSLPCIHRAKFAELNGLSDGVVGGWIDKGLVPTIKIGRYTMINLVQLAEQMKGGVL